MFAKGVSERVANPAPRLISGPSGNRVEWVKAFDA